MSPVLLGAIPFGLVSGVAAVSVSLPEDAAVAMAVIVFAGAAQIAGVQLIGNGAPIFIILLTTFVINLRFVMYSASLAPHFHKLSSWWKAFLAYFMTDQAFAFSITRFTRDPEQANKQWYYFGGAISVWVTWLISSAVGVFVGAQLPASWSLDFAIPLIFMALIFPSVTDRASAGAALVAGVVAVLAAGLPLNMSLIVAALLGIGAGLLLEPRRRS